MEEDIDEITYQVAEIISTRGEFSKSLYDYLKTSLNRYSKFDVKISYDKKLGNGEYETYYDDNYEVYNAFDNGDDLVRAGAYNDVEIVSGKDIDGNLVNNAKFKIEDRVTIQVTSLEPTVFGKLLNVSTLGYTRDSYIDTKLFALKTAVVSNNAKNLVTGYDVIMETKAGNIPAGKIIKVITKGNRNGVQTSYASAVQTYNLEAKISEGPPVVWAGYEDILFGTVKNGYDPTTPVSSLDYIPVNSNFIREETRGLRHGALTNYTYVIYRYAG